MVFYRFLPLMSTKAREYEFTGFHIINYFVLSFRLMNRFCPINAVCHPRVSYAS